MSFRSDHNGCIARAQSGANEAAKTIQQTGVFAIELHGVGLRREITPFRRGRQGAHVDEWLLAGAQLKGP